MGVRNARGVTMRSPYDGGAQERRLAERYRELAARYGNSHPRLSESGNAATKVLINGGFARASNGLNCASAILPPYPSRSPHATMETWNGNFWPWVTEGLFFERRINSSPEVGLQYASFLARERLHGKVLNFVVAANVSFDGPHRSFLIAKRMFL